MQALLNEFGNREVRAYFVWLPVLAGDTETAARECSARFPAPNSGYFWTTSLGLAYEAAAALQLAAGRPAWDVYLLYGKEVTWNARFPAPAYWQKQLEVIQGAPFDPKAFRVRLQEALK